MKPLVAAVTVLTALAIGVPVQAQTWHGLRVAPESRCSPYRASAYSYPQSIEARIVESLGGVWSPYTGRTFAGRGETDIEHMVARSEAHDSGLRAISADFLPPGVFVYGAGGAPGPEWRLGRADCGRRARVL